MHWIPNYRELVERIARQLPDFVPIGIAQRDGEDPLSHQIDLLVCNLPGLTRVPEAPGQRLRQSQALVDRLQEQRPAVRAAVLLVQLGNDRIREKGGKYNRLRCRLVIHEEALVVEERVCNTFLPQLGLSLIQPPKAS
jgi:hypothetical protein